MTIKAIETSYNGYRFRSRLEARWAVFFDNLKVTYRYEDQGYDLDGLNYLPDFWLPDLGFFVEIKPRGVDLHQDDREKARRLSKTGQMVIIHKGDPWPWSYESVLAREGELYDWPSLQWATCWTCKCASVVWSYPDGTKHYDSPYFPSPCACVGDDEGRTLRCWPYAGEMVCSHRGEVFALVDAYCAARSARFEFGEKPTGRPFIHRYTDLDGRPVKE